VRQLQALIALAGGDGEIEHVSRVFRTGTRVDVGSWFGRRKVLACMLESSVVLVARGPRPHVERVSFEALQKSLYNHVTGEVVLGPAGGVKATRLRLSPLDAVAFLKCIGVEVEEEAGAA